MSMYLVLQLEVVFSLVLSLFVFGWYLYLYLSIDSVYFYHLCHWRPPQLLYYTILFA